MPDVLRRWGARLLAMLTLAAVAAAPGLAAAPDLSTPQAAAKSLYAAVEADDGAAILATFYAATDAERDLARAFAEMIRAGKALNAAAKSKFGDAGEAIGAGMMSKEELAKVDQGELKQEGDTATLTPAGQARPIKFRRTDGKWQIVVADFAGATPQALPGQVDLLRRVATVLTEAAKDLNDGAYKTSQDAEAAIQQKLGAVMIAAAQHAGATKPATRP